MKIKYLKFGEKGEKIVFLHGWQQDKRSLTLLASFLHKNNQLFFLDLPGFGETQFSFPEMDSQKYSQLIARWLKKEKLLPATLIGHSFGGKVATLITLSNPKIVSKLILMSTPGIPQPKWWSSLIKIIPRKISKSFPLILKFKLASQDYKQAGPLLSFFKTVVKEDFRPFFAKIKTPTLIIWGEKDQEVPLKHAKIIHQLIPGSKLEILPGGHFFFQERPEKTAKIITQFIKK